MSLSFNHALVALDQSEASDIIVECLVHFEKLGTRNFTLFTSAGISYPGGLDNKNEEVYQKKLHEYRKQLQSFDFEIETEVRFKINAYAPSQILQAAKDHKADYIIIANRGRNKYLEFLLGSTATELLQRCDLPVFLINLSVTDDSELEKRKLFCVKSCRDTLENIFYPTDFSPISDRAFHAVKQLAPGHAKKVSILHVQASGRPGINEPAKLRDFDRVDTERLREFKTGIEEVCDAEVKVKIRYGSPVKQILENAANESSSLIVMGSQGRGYVSDLFLGGVCHQVVRKANIPVLTIPTDRRNENSS